MLWYNNRGFQELRVRYSHILRKQDWTSLVKGFRCNFLLWGITGILEYVVRFSQKTFLSPETFT